MFSAPSERHALRPTLAALREEHRRLLLGGLGAIAGAAIGLLGALYWLRDCGRRKRRPAPAVVMYDATTGLPTQRLFHLLVAQALGRAARTGRAVAVLVVEVRPYGAEGAAPSLSNEALVVRVAAARLKSGLHSQDALARLDDWWFAIMLNDLDEPTRAVAVARDIQAVMGMPLKVEGRELLLSCRIGGAIAPFDATEPAALLEHAARLLTNRQDHDAAVLFVSDPTTLCTAGLVSTAPSHAVVSAGQ